jgi:hypothetical protein
VSEAEFDSAIYIMLAVALAVMTHVVHLELGG